MMRSEYEQKITELKQKHRSMFGSKEISRFGLSIHAGWIPLFDELCDSIKQILPPEYDDSWQWFQVKEKFGMLRAYGDFVTGDRQFEDELEPHLYQQVEELICAAESKSASTCEVCGDTEASLYSIGGWITPRCEKHAVAGVKFYDDSPEPLDYTKKASVVPINKTVFERGDSK